MIPKWILGDILKKTSDMKARYIISLAFGAMFAFACSKEEIAQNENEQPLQKEALTEIKAEIIDTKTAYDVDGHFSWLSDDKITVVVWNDGSTEPAKLNTLNHYTFTNSTGAGTSATFTCSISSPWNEEGIALYPNVYGSGIGTVSLSYAGSHGSVQISKRQEIAPNLDCPMAAIPLIGRKNGSGIYQFKTAVGVLKVTITDIPADARYLYLVDPNKTYSFSGTFDLNDLDEIKEANAVYSSDNDYKTTISFTPRAGGETRSFYIPVPTGTIPTGTQLKLDTGSSVNIVTKTFNKTVSVVANHVTPLAAFAAETWNDVSGTGTFYDNNGFYATSSYNTPVSVTIQQNATDPSRYRVVNPYQAYIDAASLTPPGSYVGPDPYFYFTIEDGWVDFESYHTGLSYYCRWYDDTYGEFTLVHPATASASNNKWNNAVINADGSGNPLNIQLAPQYLYYSGSYSDNTYENPKIEIVFPGSASMLTVANYANGGSATCSNGTVTATIGNATITALKAVAATDLASGVAAIKADTGVLTFNASGTDSFTGLADGTYRLVYKLETSGHGFTYKDGGDFIVDSGVKIDLTSEMVSVSANETYSGDDGGPAALVDGNTNTHWHSPWSFTGTYDSTYGVYIDIDLGSGNEVTAFKARFHLRNSLNDHPDHIKIYASTDGSTWGSALADVSDIYSTYGQNSWTNLIPFTAASASRYVRIAILSTNGDNGKVSDLTTSGCTHMAELELYNMD